MDQLRKKGKEVVHTRRVSSWIRKGKRVFEKKNRWKQRHPNSEQKKKTNTRLKKRELNIPHKRNIADELGVFFNTDVNKHNFWQLTYNQIPTEFRTSLELAIIIKNYIKGDLTENQFREKLQGLGKEFIATEINRNTRIPKSIVKPCTDAFIDKGLDELGKILKKQII